MKKIFLSIVIVLITFYSPISAQDTDKNINKETPSEVVQEASDLNPNTDSLKTNFNHLYIYFL